MVLQDAFQVPYTEVLDVLRTLQHQHQRVEHLDFRFGWEVVQRVDLLQLELADACGAGFFAENAVAERGDVRGVVVEENLSEQERDTSLV